MESFTGIIDLWPNAQELAADLGTTDIHVRTMRQRGVVPPEHWPALIAGARKRGYAGITSTGLMFLYAEVRAAKRQQKLATAGGGI